MSKHVFWVAAGVALSCASRSQVEPTPQAPASVPSVEPVAEPLAEPAAEATPAEPAAGEAAKKKPALQSSGRPAIQVGPLRKIASTFGSTPASVLKLKTSAGEFVLKLNEFSLRAGTNVVFEAGARVGRGKAPVIGEMVHLATQLSDSTRFSEQDAYSAPFTVLVPSRKPVNLAIGTLEIDEQGFELAKVKSWRVVAPVRFEEGFGQAVFELDRIGPSVMHATSAAPTP